jgi:hypothetical protein
VLKGLGLELAWHAKDAMQPANVKIPVYYLCVPALGLAALALRDRVIAADGLPRTDPYFPAELIAREGT